MKSIISINRKFMGVSPKKLVELIMKSNHTTGVEICIDVDSKEEQKYLDDLVFELKKNNLVLQVHGDSELSIDKQIMFLKQLEGYTDILNHKIVVTLHSLYDEDRNVSIKKTTEYLDSITTNIDNNKLIICLENLNDARNLDRLEKELIAPIVINNEKLFFTYDIGHELADYGEVTNLSEYMIEEIRNVHIHTNDGKGVDHQPIYKNDRLWNDLLKGITYLINHKYTGNIVYEYDLYACMGNSIEEKIVDYLSSIDYVASHYEDN